MQNTETRFMYSIPHTRSHLEEMRDKLRALKPPVQGSVGHIDELLKDVDEGVAVCLPEGDDALA